jgi:DNA-binding transcriptional ArsR family regulator
LTDFSSLLSQGGVLPSLEPPANPLPRSPQGETQPAQRKGPSRFQTLNDFVDHSARLVSATAQAAWYVLFRDVKLSGQACMAHSQIAAKIGVAPRTVARALKKLEALGLVTVVKRGGLNRGSNIYRVHGKPQRLTHIAAEQ